MSEQPHILVVDDDDRLRALLGRYLRNQNFAVSLAAHAAEARALMRLFQFDLLVLDVMMPGEDGLALASSLRAANIATPILMLSARTDTPDRVAGLEAGVDDYVPKPFEPKELLLRIQAILRRAAPPSAAKGIVQFGEYRFQPATLELRHGLKTVRLTASEAALLKRLSETPGEPVSREALAACLSQNASRNIDVQVARLRRKITPDAATPPPIQTVRGAGYALLGTRI